MRVFPASGGQVSDPERGDFLPESGRNVESTQYWLRRIKAGEATTTQPVTQPVKPRGKSHGR